MSDSNREAAEGAQPGSTAETSETTYHVRDGESVTEAVIRAVSSRTQSTPRELEPLYSSVDPDALDSLFAPLAGGSRRKTDGTVAFTYNEWHVHVTVSGVLTLSRKGDEN